MALIHIANLHLHVTIDNSNVEEQLKSINKNINKMANELQNLTTEVSEATTVMQSAKVLIEGLKAKLDEAIASGDPAQLTALSDSLNTGGNELAAAIQANTPADNNGAPVTPGDTGGGGQPADGGTGNV